MSFRDADRAVTVQIGAVILLGFLVISLSLYQATVVPDQNKRIEFEHNQRVQADLQGVRNAILGTAATGSSAPTGVELGTAYPSRVVAVNPAPPSGTLSTTDLGAIEVRNATADDPATPGTDYPETADFWNGSTHSYPTKSLAYQPNYANYGNAPKTIFENGVVFNRFRSGNVTQTGQPVVSGRRISVVALSGDLSRGGTGTLTLDPQPVSVSTRTISVSNTTAGENVSVFLPTRLSADTWKDLLNESGEYDPDANATNGAYVYRVEDRSNGVELYFEAGTTYQLKLSKVGVGANAGDTDPAYLTSAEGLTTSPFEGRTYPFVVEARDKYNNPIGVQVNASANRGTVPPGTVLEPGRYRYEYTAPDSDGPDWVNVSYRSAADGAEYDITDPAFNGSKIENVQYAVMVQGATGGGGGGGGGGVCTVGTNNNPTAFQFNNLDGFNSKPSPDRWDISQVNVQDQDGDNDLSELKFEIADEGGVVRATYTVQISGQQYQDKNLRIDPDDSTYDVQSGEIYTLTATVCDGDGNSRTETRQDSS
ncbi:hypothetical protein [Halobellus marinus]|uniref:hypothetical protein n=1 Tax=Halobellus TaxID=1073986 RepID=UPI0028AF2368|nr:hypothetical protein [Halobellus sp. DFY28]